MDNNQMQQNDAQAPVQDGGVQAPAPDTVIDVNEPVQPLTDEELNNLSEDQLLDMYVEQLIAEKDLGDLDDEVKAEIHNDLKERVLFQVNRAVIAALPDAELDELNKSIDDGSINEDKMAELVKRSGINTDDIVQRTMVEFREVYLNGAIEDAAEAPAEPAPAA